MIDTFFFGLADGRNGNPVSVLSAFLHIYMDGAYKILHSKGSGLSTCRGETNSSWEGFSQMETLNVRKWALLDI